MAYNNTPPPSNPEAIPQYLERELQNLAQEINNAPGYVEEQFKSIASDANSRGKSEGIPVWDKTHKRPVWPRGRSKESEWVDGVGAIVYSPK